MYKESDELNLDSDRSQKGVCKSRCQIPAGKRSTAIIWLMAQEIQKEKKKKKQIYRWKIQAHLVGGCLEETLLYFQTAVGKETD